MITKKVNLTRTCTEYWEGEVEFEVGLSDDDLWAVAMDAHSDGRLKCVHTDTHNIDVEYEETEEEQS